MPVCAQLSDSTTNVAFALALAVLLAASPVVASPVNALASPTTGNAAPEIVALYPNPVAKGDVGEFVVVRFSSQTALSEWSLADDHDTVALPNATVSGRVAFSTDPRAARNLTDLRVIRLTEDLALANEGETVEIVSDNTGGNGPEIASTATYEDAPEGKRWHRAESDSEGESGSGSEGGNKSRYRSEKGWQWTPLGATDFEVARFGRANATAFVLPDAPGVPVETLRSADRRILLAGYTFTSSRAADALASASRRGVQVHVLVDAAPVGGMTRREAKLLDSLVARGVEVRVLGGPAARYDFHHAKYAIADDRALVLTENWKPSGTGGNASRGWGVVLRNETVAGRLTEVFEADSGWRDATPWSAFRHGRSFDPARSPPANGSFPARISSSNVNISQSSILVAPDNAEKSVVALLGSANESIRVQQVAIGSRSQPFLRATLRAARRGVEVRILLSSAWYVEEDNRALVEWLNGVAKEEGLPLKARLANPRGRYEKIHAKGVVVDGEAAVVGSLNWNNNSARDNREVAVVLRGKEVGGYYANAFDEDWTASARGTLEQVPVGLLGAVALGAIVAIVVARREVSFENGP